MCVSEVSRDELMLEIAFFLTIEPHDVYRMFFVVVASQRAVTLFLVSKQRVAGC